MCVVNISLACVSQAAFFSFRNRVHFPQADLPDVSNTGTVFESWQIGQSCTNLRPPPWTTLGRAPRLRWGIICREINQSSLRVASPSLFLFSRHDQALDQRIHYGAARHGPRLCTVMDGDVVVTEACPHRHARHGIQTRA